MPPAQFPRYQSLRPGEVPRPLRIARVILWIQFAGTALLTLVEFAQISTLSQHGQDVPGSTVFVLIDDPLVSILALISAIFIAKPRTWVRPLATVVESIAILNGVINIVGGAFAGVIGIGLAIWVIFLLFNSGVTAWLRAAGDNQYAVPPQQYPFS
jgi:hypothetical protein